MSSVANVRFITNPFPENDGQSYLSNDGISLNENVKQFLTQNIIRLFQYWEANLNKFDWNDSSVYTGLMGAASLYFKLYECKVYSNPEVYLQKAFNLIQHAFKSYRKINVPTFICGETGLLSMAALVVNSLGNDCSEYLRQIASIQQSVCNIDSNLPDELLYGRAGYLYSLLLIRSKISNSVNIITNDLVRSVVIAMLNSGMKTSNNFRNEAPLMYFWYNEAYVGAAHGYAGILYILLEAIQFLTQDELNRLVKPTIDFICNLQYPNTANFVPCIGDAEDKLIHWCHGSPGVIHLLVLAYKIFGDPKYLQISMIASDDIWKRGLLKKGYGLCHGASGNAYAFLRLFQLTKDKKYLYRAVKFAEWCSAYGSHNCQTPDTPFSLFEGMAGTLYYLVDLLDPYHAKYPAFQLS